MKSNTVPNRLLFYRPCPVDNMRLNKDMTSCLLIRDYLLLWDVNNICDKK